MHRICVAIVLLGPMAALADTSFWVSVGSFQDTVVAERVKDQAENALNEPFVVQRSETPGGVYQRVATGPFASREAALTAQDHAKASGYPDSWIFAVQTDGTPAGSADDSSLARVLNDDSTTVDSAANLDAMEHDLTDQAPGETALPQSRLEEVLQTIEEVPTEIPPGYQLNQLFRDGVVPSPEHKH